MQESLGHQSVEDRIGAAPGTPAFNISELGGSWVNTEATPVAISRAIIESRGSSIYVKTSGAEINGATSWGEATADRCYAASPASCDAVGVTASRDGPLGTVRLHANVSKGLLIITSVSRSAASYGVFAREFFRRVPSPVGRIPDQAPRPNGPGLVPTDGPSLARHSTKVAGLPCPSIFVGTWRNTQRKPAVVASVSFSPADNPLLLQVVGVGAGGSIDWGKFDVELLTDGPHSDEPSKIMGGFQLEDRDVLLHGWVKQGVLVLALFYGFRGGDGRSSYFDREFFYRESDMA